MHSSGKSPARLMQISPQQVADQQGQRKDQGLGQGSGSGLGSGSGVRVRVRVMVRVRVRVRVRVVRVKLRRMFVRQQLSASDQGRPHTLRTHRRAKPGGVARTGRASNCLPNPHMTNMSFVTLAMLLPSCIATQNLHWEAGSLESRADARRRHEATGLSVIGQRSPA